MNKKQAVETGGGRPTRGPGRKAPPPMAASEEEGERGPWRVVRGGAALIRSYTFPNPVVAANFSQLALGLAAHAGLPLFVRLLDSNVTLALRGRGGRSVSSLAGELFDRIASLS